MSGKKYRIFSVNPGSTSTKVALFENETRLLEEDVFHDSSFLKTFKTINDQLDYRMTVVQKFLQDNRIDLHGIDAIVGRGGPCFPIPGGTYTVDERLVEDTRNARGGLYHSSMLGVQMAMRLHRQYGGLCLMVDPTVTDEYQDLARVTGLKGVYRHVALHALNMKAVARKYAAECGRPYEQLRLITAHIDGGISMAAHENGRMIDGIDGGGGEGPFTPTRMGGLAVTDCNRLLRQYSYEEVRQFTSVTGGLSSYFGTSNADAVHEKVLAGDPEAVRVWSALSYQCAKTIASLSAVLAGRIDAILLTGGLMRFDDLIADIRQRCGWIAPIRVYPGEYEHEAMTAAALRVLRGQEEAKTYPGKPVFTGFPEDQNGNAG